MSAESRIQVSSLSRFRAGLGLIGRIEIVLAVILLFYIVIIISVGVFFRYVLGSSIVFVEESATIGFIWITFLGAAAANKMRRHITITTLSGILGSGVRRALGVFCDVFVLILAITVAIFAYRYIEPQNRSPTVSLPFNFPRGWVFAMPTLYAMTSIAVTQLAFVADSVVRRPADGTAASPAIL